MITTKPYNTLAERERGRGGAGQGQGRCSAAAVVTGCVASAELSHRRANLGHMVCRSTEHLNITVRRSTQQQSLDQRCARLYIYICVPTQMKPDTVMRRMSSIWKFLSETLLHAGQVKQR
jgi:hypothetical protein